jgi:hypothetical protein
MLIKGLSSPIALNKIVYSDDCLNVAYVKSSLINLSERHSGIYTTLPTVIA